MRRPALPAVCCALLVVLSGCGTLGGTATDTTPRTGKVVVVGASPEFDVQRLYRRLLSMHGEDLRGAARFAIDVDDPAASVTSYYPSRFGRLWGFGFDPSNRSTAPLLGLGPYPRNGTPCARQRWLAYYVASHVQDGPAESRSLIDVATARRAIAAGAAAFAARRYVTKHTDCEPVAPSWQSLRVNGSPSATFVAVQRYAGLQYVAGHVDAVSGVSKLLSSPPPTTEQVLHGYGVDAEPATTLSVATSTGGGWQVNNSWGAPWIAFDGQQRMGELFVRTLLAGELPADRAAAAAAGWGNDRVVRFQRGGAVGYAWVLRWDRTRDADAFVAAMRDYLGARGRTAGGVRRVDGTTFDVRRPGKRTVVVFAGSGSFVGAASASGGGGDVTVTVGGGGRVGDRPAAPVAARELRRTSGR